MKEKPKQTKKKRLRIASLAVCMTMVMGTFAAAPAMAKTELTLVKSQTHYYKDGKKWKKSVEKTSYKYNKRKDPIKMKGVSFMGQPFTTKLKWTYKKGKRAKMVEVPIYKSSKKSKMKAHYGDREEFTYKKNRRVHLNSYQEGKLNYSEKYLYNKKGYIKGKYKYHKNGLPKKISNITLAIVKDHIDGTYADKDDATYYCNKKGLITKIYNGRAAKQAIKYKYDKKGRVKELILIYDAKDPNFIKYKIKYKYTNIKIDKIRYAKMINHTAVENTGSSFASYFDHWY